jgi:DNA-binding CsgD family transcriptional regulator
MELLAKGLDCSQQTQFKLRGKRNQLSCIPANGIVICMLSSDNGEAPAMMQSLSPREREILMLLADGETTATAADLLGVNESTIRTHVERMRGKFAVNTRAAVVAKGFQLGYLE